jgi:hypothetical protein
MNGRLRRRALRYALLLDELAPQGPAPVPQPEPHPDRPVLFQAVLDTGQVGTRAELARLLGRSRAWVTKVLATAAKADQAQASGVAG